MWKALGSKGLCEIEEIGKEEAFIKMMQSLERFMRSHPEVWSEPSVQHLLVVHSFSLFSYFMTCLANFMISMRAIPLVILAYAQ